MKTLYLDCSMGAAGDMLAAALLELLPDKAGFLERMNRIGLPGTAVAGEPSVKCGITGTHFAVVVNGMEEDEHLHEHHHEHEHEHEHEHDHHHDHKHEHDHDHDHDHHHDHEHEHEHDHDHDHHHDHDHDHEHGHHHHHSSLHDIEHIAAGLAVSEKVRADVLNIYRLIAEAESHAHGFPVSEIHFHEVGTMDAITDITAVCMLMEELAVDQVIASPIHVGAGHVHCAHGILPVPAPATAYILKGCPIYGGKVQSELCTPTGAALLRYFVKDFGVMPVMSVSAIGYGMGKKDFAQANCVRAMLGETAGSRDTITELSCNVDDMTAEELGFAMDRLYDGGAVEVFTTPAGMKKSRPGQILHVFCKEENREPLLSLIFRHTTTIGIRISRMERCVLDRAFCTHETKYGTVREKVSSGYGVTRRKYEYDDLARIAKEQGLSLQEVRRLVETEK